MDLQPRDCDETGIVRPYFGHTCLECSEADVQIEDARPANIQLISDLQTPRHEGRRRRKDDRPGGVDKRFNEPSCRCGTRSAAGAGGMRHDAPELEKARRRDTPTPDVVRGLLDSAARRLMLGATGPVRVNEEVGVHGDHG